MPVAPRRIRELDALRGLAALVVVLHHVFVIFSDEIFGRFNGWFLDLLTVVQAQNKGAVLLFFVMSGYAIGLATRGACAPRSGPSIKEYAARRARRIMPLYYLSLAWTALCGLVYGMTDPSFSAQTLLSNMLFLQTSAAAKETWFVPFGLNGPYWSLSYEAFFYIVLPLALWVGHRVLPQAPHTALIGLAVLGSLAGLAVNQVLPSPFGLFLSHWIVWVLGFAAVYLRSDLRDTATLLAPLVILGGVWLILPALAGRDSDTLNAVVEGCFIGSLFGLVALYPGWTESRLMRLIRRAVVFLLGRIGDGSYALYLLHYPLLLALHARLDAPFGTTPWWMAGGILLLFIFLICPWVERWSLTLWPLRARP